MVKALFPLSMGFLAALFVHAAEGPFWAVVAVGCIVASIFGAAMMASDRQ